MKLAITLALILSACYDKSDAVSQLQNMGRPAPIQCVSLNGQEGTSRSSFTCTDGDGLVWACDEQACINTGRSDARAEKL